MPRPTDKTQLSDAAATGYSKLTALAATFSADQREAVFGFADRDRNLRDVLAHLTAWHQMMRRWYDEGMAGGKPAIPGEGYTWQTLPALNQAIWEDAQNLSLSEAVSQLEASHADMMGIIEAHTDEELFTKKLYPWTGTTSLGAYLISATSSHYDWAVKKLRRALKTW
ncbi:MAG: ClbS/DfsB family four-helix bundle protein [Bifidobacteriaceae bacterium]|jgi:hypothetical protein|nr:ClbS/DfsB family four-helix bundle protein [Bifidobacteriaceae bacterium]